jgi:hypothetical protein
MEKFMVGKPACTSNEAPRRGDPDAAFRIASRA